MKTIKSLDHFLLKSLTVIILIFISVSVFGQAPDNHFLNATDYGVSPSLADNYNKLDSLFINHPNSDIYVPPGVYKIVNDSVTHGGQGYLKIQNYQGHLLCGANTIFQFQKAQGGFNFLGGTGARLENIHVEFATLPSTRNNLHSINVGMAQNIVVNNITVNGSGGVGLLFNLCYNPQVSNIVITNTMADGCSFYSCQNVQLNGLITKNTGDDAMAFFQSSGKLPLERATITNLILKQSYARGIAINGTSDVYISNFMIDSTSAAGIYVAKESSVTYRPTNIFIANGNVRHGGVLTGRGVTGSKNGVTVTGAGSVYLNNVAVKRSQEKGFYVYNTNFINAAQIAVDTSGTLGVAIDTNVMTVLRNITSKNSGQYGIKITKNKNAIAENLTVNNAWKDAAVTPNLHRAIWFESNVNFYSDALTLLDDDATTTTARADTVGEYNTLGSGYFGDIQYMISSTSPQVFGLVSSSTTVKTGLINLLPKGGVKNGIVYQGDKSLLTTAAGTSGQFLSNASGTPVWVTPIVQGPSSTSFTGAASVTVTFTSPGFTPSNVLWTPTNSIGTSGWYITGITSTSFTINYTTTPSGTVTGKYTLIK
ncbi:Right handed beta helix region [Mucilaginibacter gossypiicola]|uniref:Right handed beta helix region n=1 Tax=Mucilaginibacter gossypiicola TaxID=551995 RepID=A0A1H8NPM2_9SPHI|nr:right-handed parallel beta-helix repeat-containing protein [Mucilaginibacter gossypiicola]SEO31566.1 Right handed beta helix region [Mucilaginibacter gossypiicola]